jgi:hypothetical protein
VEEPTCASTRTSSTAGRGISPSAVSRRASYGLFHSLPVPSQLCRAMQCSPGAFLTLIDRGDCGITSNVAKAGALVSPALISPPSPLDFLRDHVVLTLSLVLGLEIRSTLSWVVMSCGKASVVGMVYSKAFNQAIQGYSRQGVRSHIG